MNGVGSGDAELVEIQVSSESGVPAALVSDARSMDPIEGAKVRFHPGNGEGLREDWCATVGPGPRGFDIRRVTHEQHSTSRDGPYRFRADTGDPKRTLEFFGGAVNLVAASRAQWRSASHSGRILTVEDARCTGENLIGPDIFLDLLLGLIVFI